MLLKHTEIRVSLFNRCLWQVTSPLCHLYQFSQLLAEYTPTDISHLLVTGKGPWSKLVWKAVQVCGNFNINCKFKTYRAKIFWDFRKLFVCTMQLAHNRLSVVFLWFWLTLSYWVWLCPVFLWQDELVTQTPMKPASQ